MRIIGEPKKKKAVLVALPSMVLLVCLYFLGAVRSFDHLAAATDGK